MLNRRNICHLPKIWKCKIIGPTTCDVCGAITWWMRSLFCVSLPRVIGAVRIYSILRVVYNFCAYLWDVSVLFSNCFVIVLGFHSIDPFCCNVLYLTRMIMIKRCLYYDIRPSILSIRYSVLAFCFGYWNGIDNLIYFC